MILLTFDWKSSIPALKKSSLSDCKAFAVKATIGVFTPKARSCRVAYANNEFYVNISHVISSHTHTHTMHSNDARTHICTYTNLV